MKATCKRTNGDAWVVRVRDAEHPGVVAVFNYAATEGGMDWKALTIEHTLRGSQLALSDLRSTFPMSEWEAEARRAMVKGRRSEAAALVRDRLAEALAQNPGDRRRAFLLRHAEMAKDYLAMELAGVRDPATQLAQDRGLTANQVRVQAHRARQAGLL